MRRSMLMRRHPFVTAAAIVATALTACDELPTEPDEAETYFGPSESLGNGHVRTYVELDGNGTPSEMGVVITENAFSGLPTGPEPLQLVLTFAEEAEQTPFQHVLFDWNPHGHEPPGMYDLPHFDVHFYTTSSADRELIVPDDPEYEAKLAAAPSPEYMPEGYVQFPGGVPQMGAHWGDPTAPEHQGETFTTTLLWGSYDGDVTFVEPMMTKAWLESRPAFEEALILPETYQVGGYWPTSYGASHDAQASEHRIYLGGLIERQSS